MESHVHIEGVPPYNGDWELDVTSLNGEELHTIKMISGVRANELEEAFEAGDYDLVIAFAVISLKRAGQRPDVDLLRAAQVGKIILNAGEEDDARPPALRMPSGVENSPGENKNGVAKTDSSGSNLRSDGDDPANDQSLTGPPGLEDSLKSVHAILDS